MNEASVMTDASLERRRVQPFDIEVPPAAFDDLGFLKPSGTPAAFPVINLMSAPTAIVAGPPWAGKSYLARKLAAAARRRGRVHFLSLEEGQRTDFSIRWDGLDDLTSGSAWCIVDALDEAIYGDLSLHDVLQPIADCRRSTKDVNLLLFARDDSTLAQVRSVVGSVLGDSSIMRLLPLDRAEARELYRDEEHWSRLSAHLRDPRLRPFARYHRALAFLCRQDPPLAPAEVWRGMLRELCTETRRSDHFRSTPQERVTAAERLAAVLLLSRRSVIDLEDGIVSGSIIPRDVFPAENTYQVALQDLARTSLLERASEGGFRFRFRFALETFAALACAQLKPEALCSLVTSYRGHFRDDLAEFAEQLGELSPKHVAFIKARSRAGAPSIAEVKEWLSRLVSAADSSQVWVDGQSIFRSINVPGLEHELASRLRSSAPAGGSDLLIDIAETNSIAGASGIG